MAGSIHIATRVKPGLAQANTSWNSRGQKYWLIARTLCLGLQISTMKMHNVFTDDANDRKG